MAAAGGGDLMEPGWPSRSLLPVSRHGSSGSVTTSGEEQLAEFDSQFLRAGGLECLERADCQPIAVRGARRWSGRRQANRSEPAVRSAPRSPVRERVNRGLGGLVVRSDVAEPG